MDLLTDLLQQAGLRRRLLDLRRLGPATALRFPCEKSIGLHVVTHGTVYLHAPALPQPLALASGDIAVMARGCEHLVATLARMRKSDTITDIGFSPEAPVPGQEQGATSAVISGAYQLWNRPVHPFFQEMPDWFVLRADEIPRLGPLALAIGMLDDEVNARAMGAQTVVHGLLDVVFTFLLREMLLRQAGGAASWGHAVSDRQVREAIALMHDDCAQPWTLEVLASRAGLSRTSLAERFRQAMGDTPLSYLRTVRMQQAMRILSETERSLEQVAREVGYTDAFSFSKVFKREVGMPPREFRRQDRADRQSAWRIQGA